MFIRAGKRPLPMTKQMRGEQFRVMGVFRAVKVDQRRDSAARLLTGETVHQFRKKGFTDAGRPGKQNV